MAVDVIISVPSIIIDIAEVSGPRGDPGTPGTPGIQGPPGPPGEPAPETATMIVSAIDEPPDPGVEGVQWYDPSTGNTNVWYAGEWQLMGVPAPSSPTPADGQELSISVGPVLTLIKMLDLPVPYFDGGNAYWAQFPKALASGMADPSFFPFGVFLSPGFLHYPINAAAAGITHYEAIEATSGYLTGALAAGLHVNPHSGEWSPDQVDAEDGDSDPHVTGWHSTDEPDMFSSLGALQSTVSYLRSLDDGRYVTLNIGHGIYGLPLWSPTTTDDMVHLVDVCTVDSYLYSAGYIREFITPTSPYWTGPTDPDLIRRAASYGWLADRMRAFQEADNPKPYGIFVELARPLLGAYDHGPHITLPEISGAVWSGIRHGSRIINFFQHNDDPEIEFYSLAEGASTVIRGHVTALTSEVTALAEVIDGPTYEWDFGDANVETMLKAYDGNAYIFAGTSLNSPMPGRGTTDIEQVGEVLEFQFTDTAETGTVSSTIEVAVDAEIVVVAVSGLHGTNNGFAGMTFTKGGVDTAMTKATGGDVTGGSWQSAIFYMVLPDTGASKSLKWDWLGAASEGERVIAVTFWKGIDLNNPVRDSNGFQDAGFGLEETILSETPTLEVADGDLVLAFCGMYNPAEDGAAKVNVWHHMTRLTDLDYEGSAEGMLATATPDGDCTFGITNISHATEAAFVAIVLKHATLQAVTSTVTQVGTLVEMNSGGSNANTGTFFGTVEVPAGTEFALVVATGFSQTDNMFASITMEKGAVPVAMTRLTGGDVTGDAWQGAMFYMVEPDIGAGKVMTWDWAGAGSMDVPPSFFITFWEGVDLTDPIRDSNGAQIVEQYDGGPLEEFPLNLPMLTNREGDLVVAFFVGSVNSGDEGSVTTWKNLTLESEFVADTFYDAAWATSAVIGSLQVGVTAVVNFEQGALVAAVLKPAAAVTPATPDAEPPTTARTIITATFTLPPDLAAATDVEVLNESRTISVAAGEFTDTFDEEFTYHNYRIPL